MEDEDDRYRPSMMRQAFEAKAEAFPVMLALGLGVFILADGDLHGLWGLAQAAGGVALILGGIAYAAYRWPRI